MRSSDVHRAFRIALTGFWLAAVTLPAACAQNEAPRAGNVLDCQGADANGAATADNIAAVRKNTEGGPLFTLLASSSRPERCTVSADEGRITVTYTFANGGSLRAVSDPRIEYTNLEARFTSGHVADPIDVLKRVEQSMFADGCEIKWTAPETATGDGGAATRETIYRGETCNCQTRIGKSPSGDVVSLTFRSAC